MDIRNRRDWAAYEPGAIPTKADISPLEAWLDRFPAPRGTRILDLGCGSGEITAALQGRGFDTTGVDVNAGAIEAARHRGSGAVFMVGDVAGPQGLDPALGRFDGIVCQLLLSVVGDPSDRRQALVNAHGALVTGGSLFASFSGRSDDINPEYARSYREDFAETREDGTYFSRDEQGNVLYRTHHFRQDEVLALMEAAGFSGIDIQERIESSSRRPEQKARFLYATAVKA